MQLVATGAAKANLPLHKGVLLSLLAGAFIGFGSMMVLSVGAACPGLAAQNPGLQRLVAGSFGLPLGLLLVMVTGADLFTGNCMLLSLAVRPPIPHAALHSQCLPCLLRRLIMVPCMHAPWLIGQMLIVGVAEAPFLCVVDCNVLLMRGDS